jgi:undecaprenyl-diphosphatase
MSDVTSEREAPSDERPDGRPPAGLGSTWLLHRRELLQLLAAYVVLTAAFALAGTWLKSADDSAIVRLDQRVADRFVETRTPTLNDWSLVASWAAETVTKIAVTALLVGIMLAVWRRWREPLMLAVPLVLEAATFLTVTLIVARPRPDVPRLDESPVDSSFPSGHVAAAACYGAIVIVAVWRRWRPSVTLTLGLFVAAVTLAVAWARMYRGMHFLSDTVAGALLGLSAVIVSWWILRRAEPRPWRHKS